MLWRWRRSGIHINRTSINKEKEEDKHAQENEARTREHFQIEGMGKISKEAILAGTRSEGIDRLVYAICHEDKDD